MTQIQERINAFAALGQFIGQFTAEPFEKSQNLPQNDPYFDKMQDVLSRASASNGWFTLDNIRFALQNWSVALQQENLEKWLAPYNLSDQNDSKTVAIVMAGNVPLVGFHDFLCVLIAGHSATVKLSSNDKILLPFLAEYLQSVAPLFSGRIQFTTDQLRNFDAVIATGSDNTALYFEHYFGKYPHIIRKNRNSVAILDGNETPAQIEKLADDVFRYFGLGCRNVSKFYVPKGYDWDHFFNGMYTWKAVINNHKYMNNYDYNKAVYLMSNIKLLDNEFLLLKEDPGYASPIAVLFYEYYEDKAQLEASLAEHSEKIQCVVASDALPFGHAQQPALSDYADGIDTMSFLIELS
ncbi:MAG: acyl-CoA reductase [Marinirhabdus sp.]|nr:acyl-CoA reductase [Marinirhabdus sp.]